MEITEIKVFPVQEEKLKAFVSVVFDRCFMVNDIKIIQGRQGLFISMPSRKKKNGEFKDVAHPLNNDTRQMIEGQVLTEYDRVLEERAGDRSQPRRVPKRRTEPKSTKREAAQEAEAKRAAGVRKSDGVGSTDEAEGTTRQTRRRRRRSRSESAVAKATGAEEASTRGTKGGGTKNEETTAEAEETATSGAGTKEVTGEPAEGKTEDEDRAQKTLEEVEEMHLRDSFWSVP